MLIKKAPDIRSSEITPKDIYLRRREFIQGSAAALVGAGLAGWPGEAEAQIPRTKLPDVKKSPLSTTETPSEYEYVTSYNNFYEFASGAGDGPKANSKNFKNRPVDPRDRGPGRQARQLPARRLPEAVRARRADLPHAVRGGVVVRDPVGRHPAGRRHQEGRADVARPSSSSSRRCTTSARFPAQRTDSLDWPYVEGLRLDEANHPLTILAVGIYGEVLPAQNGAPIRLVVPWKYGFKGVKSIVKMRFVEKQPRNTWQAMAPQRVRLLRQREPDGRSPAVEPGARAAPAELRAQPAHRDVQRVRRPGAKSLCRDGPPPQLLIVRRPPRPGPRAGS